MKIAMVHYHLKIGGVTTVVERQVAALQNSCDLIVLTGDRAAMQLPCPVVEIRGLGYDRQLGPQMLPAETAEQLDQAIHQQWPSGCDLLHIHNPLLAKNRQFLTIIHRLQQTGVPIFLQIHDFAEDGRPLVYFDEPYPQNCHYGVINLRDRNALRAAGLTEAGLHYLPNTVTASTVDAIRSPKAQILYPVRAIRRKNLGEAALLSLFFKNGQRMVVTQPPNSPGDAASYRDWKWWIAEQCLPIELEAGQHSDFATLVADSASFVTTSVTEGFGMAFLEPWTAGKPLVGRRLPDVCTDYEARGIRLDGLYNELNVPLDWLDGERFFTRWCTAVFAVADRFGRHLPERRVTDAFDRMTATGTVDFGLLSEALQRQVLSQVAASQLAKEALTDLNPWLAAPDGSLIPRETIENNHAAVIHHFGPERYRERLLRIYTRVVQRPVRQRIEKKALLDAFFRLERFSLLQWGPYEQA